MKKFNLVLISNGFNDNSYRSEEIKNLFEKITKDKKVLLILNATKEGSKYNLSKDYSL